MKFRSARRKEIGFGAEAVDAILVSRNDATSSPTERNRLIYTQGKMETTTQFCPPHSLFMCAPQALPASRAQSEVTTIQTQGG